MTQERLEERLREELRELARVPVPSIAARVLSQLPERRPRRRLLATAWAAAAALAIVAALVGSRPDAQRTEPLVQAHPAPAVAAESAARLVLDAPVAPEAPLRDEARRLASDTRRAAHSLWDRMPMSSLISRQLPFAVTGRSND